MSQIKRHPSPSFRYHEVTFPSSFVGILRMSTSPFVLPCPFLPSMASNPSSWDLQPCPCPSQQALQAQLYPNLQEAH